MNTPPRIGIIGGNGWIGGALARAMVDTGLLPPASLILSCRSTPPDWLPDVVWTHDNQQLADSADVVILSIRLEDWPQIGISAPGKLVISVMAGMPLADIAARVRTARVVRALPNAAADVGKSYTPWTATSAVTDGDRTVVRRVFDACGTQDEVPREADVDYLTGHSGTGPAYPALLAAAMMMDAIAHGIPKDVARRAVVGRLVGTRRIFEKTGEDPTDTVAAFVDYRGVTAAGIEAMQEGGLQEFVSAGLSAALGKSLSIKHPA